MRWIVSLSLVLMACGGAQIPTHNGYKPKEVKPWKKPKVMKFNDKMEAKADGEVSYPEMRRARWYQVELPSSGELSLMLEITPPGDAVNEEFDLAMEVLDPSLRVISKADLEEGDAFELTKKKTLVDLAAGKYLIHLYLQGRMDSADYLLRASFTPSTAANVASNFPADVLFVPALPMVPLQDDTPRDYKPPGATVTRVIRTPRPRPEPTPAAPVETITARIINVQVVSGGTQITVGRGTATGATATMRATLNGIPGSFPVACNERTCTGTIKATPDQIKAGGVNATLSP